MIHKHFFRDLRWTPLTRPGVDYVFMLVCLAARETHTPGLARLLH